MGLTSIHWRESWKYGERAFRYCHHDAGHAIGSVAVSAAGLGWETRLLESVTDAELAVLLGVHVQAGVEAEHADLTPGLYVLLRDPARREALERAMDGAFVWTRAVCHLTMGAPVDDPRLQTHPPYQHLARRRP